MEEFKVKEIFDSIVSEAKKLAVNEFNGLSESISKDTKEFLENSKMNLTKWGDKLKTGELKPNEFEFLVKNQANLLKMKALTQAGKTAVAIDNVRQGILDVVSKVMIRLIL